MTKQRAVAILTTVTILIFMALGGVLSKLALTNVRPLTLTWTAVAVGLVAMVTYTFGIRRERIPHMSREVWLYIIAIGFFNFVVGRITQVFSLSLMPATTNSYLTNFIGFITMAMSIFILHESPTIFQLLGAGVALVGLRIFFVQIPPPAELLGAGLTLIGILGIAFTNNIARKLAIVTNNQISNNVISTLAILIGGSITVLVGIIVDWPLRVTGLANWGIILYIGLVSTALGLTVWNNILRVLRSYEASILGASSVIWTALLAVPILGERLSPNQVGGIALMITGLALVQVRAGKFSSLFRKKPAPETNEIL